MTNRQHNLIMSIFSRCDEIGKEIESTDYADPRYRELLGAHKELIRLADRLKMQFTAEADALAKLHSYVSDSVNINA